MIEIIRERLQTYSDHTAPEHALKEIIQELALFGLWRAGLFDVAAFQGGTSLRIIHGIPRFSEDLDFILKEPNEGFGWSKYLDRLVETLTQFGLGAEVTDRTAMDRQVRHALIKDNSLASQLDLSFYRGTPGQKLRVKLEVDINPPAHSLFDYAFLDFPADFEVCHQDLSSNFALKIHALLCRPWIKGRDWYDFTWYVRQRIKPNLPHLAAALAQFGPWQGQSQRLDVAWLEAALRTRITEIDWNVARADVEQFLQPVERESLRLWSERFFSARVVALMNMFG